MKCTQSYQSLTAVSNTVMRALVWGKSVMAASGKTVSWQDVNNVLKGLFNFLCTGTGSEARRRGILGDGTVFEARLILWCGGDG